MTNAKKTVSFIKGTHVKKSFLPDNKVISLLGLDEYEKYLPIVAKLLFRLLTQLKAISKKIEVLRSNIIHSLSHVLSSCRVEKASLYALDNHIKNFIRYITTTPVTTLPFFYAERNLGGLGIGK